jgi:HEAT repeat protein
MRVAALALVVLSLQDARPFKEWVDQLRSDSIDEREEATRRLRAAGRAAEAELKKAAADADAEVAQRARHLLRILELRDLLSDGLRQALPGIEERLAGGPPQAWVEAFMSASAKPDVKPQDLGPLVGPALKNAATNDLRIQVMNQAGQRQIQAAAPELIRYLRDKSPDLSQAAAYALCQTQAPESRPEILKLLADKDVEARRLGALIAGNMGIREAAPGLAKLLADRDREVRRRAVRAIVELDAREAAPQIVALLKDGQTDVRMTAAQALGELGAREAVPDVARLLKDPEEEVRQASLTALGRFGAREAVPDMLPLLADKDEDVRTAAAWVLGNLRAREAAPGLLRLLDDKDWYEARGAAAWALVLLGVKEAAPGLTRLLEDEEEEVRAVAAWGLGALGAKEAAPKLLKLLEDRKGEVQVSAAGALGALGAKEAGPALARQLADADDELRDTAAWALGRIGAKEALPDVLKLLASENPETRESAVLALYALRDPGAIQPLEDLVKKDDRAGAEGLRALRHAATAPRFIELLGHADAPLRATAAAALGELGSKEAVPALLKRAADEKEEQEVRGAAADALGRIGSREAVDVIAKLAAADLDEELSVLALRALERLDPARAVEAAKAHVEDGTSAEGRQAAGEILCHAGRREGARIVIEQGELYTSLNALRKPGLWKKLAETRVGGDLEGTQVEIAERIARLAGLTLEWRPEDNWIDFDSLLARRRILDRTGRLTAAEALEQLMKLTDYDFEALVEDDRLIVFPSWDATRFWERWWEGEKKN